MMDQENDSAVSEAVLSDWRNRTVISVSDLRWADESKTMLNCKVLFQELSSFGAIPFTAIEDADTQHGLEIWNNATSGEYGKIADFVAPTSEQIRERLPHLTARQLRLGLLSLGKLGDVPAAIAALPSPDKEQAEIEWQYASEFRRLHPLIVQLIPILGLSDDQIDGIWLEYSTV